MRPDAHRMPSYHDLRVAGPKENSVSWVSEVLIIELATRRVLITRRFSPSTPDWKSTSLAHFVLAIEELRNHVIFENASKTLLEPTPSVRCE